MPELFEEKPKSVEELVSHISQKYDLDNKTENKETQQYEKNKPR